jgi:hypothetical protein
MREREGLAVVAEVFLDKVGGEITDVVSPHAFTDKADFFKVTAASDPLSAKVAKEPMQVLMQRDSEIEPEAGPSVAELRKTQPSLLDFGEAIPRSQQRVMDWSAQGFIT